MGTRYETGCDFYGYLNRFQNIITEHNSISELLLKPEPGFRATTLAIRLMGGDYLWLNVVCSAIIVTCFVVFCGYYRGSLLIIALLFPVMIVQLGMSGLRQAMAVGFLMIASIPFVNGRKVWTGIWVIFASQFHSSAIIFLPIAALAGRDIAPLKIVVGSLLVSPVVVYLMGDRIDVYQDRYVNDVYGEINSQGAFIRYVLILIPTIVFFKYRNILMKEYSKNYPLWYIFSLLTLLIIFIAIINTTALHRMIYYIMPFSLLIYIYTNNKKLFGNAHNQYIYLAIFSYGTYMVFWFAFSRHADLCYIPYNSFLLI